jgi:hypothetical protein
MAFAQTTVETTTTRTKCPTYLTNLVVDFVDSTPHSVEIGTTVVTTFHVVYPDGTPVTLSPETASFSWTSSSGQKVIENVVVVPVAGKPGWYTYTQTVDSSFPTGTVTISVLYCCLSDALGNYGPTDDTSSDTTLTVEDNSKVNVGPPTPKPLTMQELLATYAIPIVIAILVIIALLLLAARARRKKGT